MSFHIEGLVRKLKKLKGDCLLDKSAGDARSGVLAESGCDCRSEGRPDLRDGNIQGTAGQEGRVLRLLGRTHHRNPRRRIGAWLVNHRLFKVFSPKKFE